jgi:hypothetical protein
MKAMIALLTIVGILGSPVWISLAILAVPRRWWPLDLVLCGLQALVAYFLWWFFWGGGIGGEARLSPMWEWLGALAFLPVVVGALKHVMKP